LQRCLLAAMAFWIVPNSLYSHVNHALFCFCFCFFSLRMIPAHLRYWALLCCICNKVLVSDLDLNRLRAKTPVPGGLEVDTNAILYILLLTCLSTEYPLLRQNADHTPGIYYVR
ncbi:hypothetical protein ANOM_003957, partial [Aspergillus nomiae NRRL 13137]